MSRLSQFDSCVKIRMDPDGEVGEAKQICEVDWHVPSVKGGDWPQVLGKPVAD